MALKKDGNVDNYAEEMLKDVKPINTGSLKQVTFRVDGGVYDELCKMAKEMGIGKSAIVRIAVSKLAKERSLSL